jgi:hypothetical protein
MIMNTVVTFTLAVAVAYLGTVAAFQPAYTQTAPPTVVSKRHPPIGNEADKFRSQ